MKWFKMLHRIFVEECCSNTIQHEEVGNVQFGDFIGLCACVVCYVNIFTYSHLKKQIIWNCVSAQYERNITFTVF